MFHKFIDRKNPATPPLGANWWDLGVSECVQAGVNVCSYFLVFLLLIHNIKIWKTLDEIQFFILSAKLSK